MASNPHLGAFRHGGRLSETAAAYPCAPQPWLDLSTGINPEPWAGARASDRSLRSLPDPQSLAALEAVAAQAFGVDDPRRVVAVGGAEAALRLLPVLLPAGEAALASPLYGGHVEAWSRRGALRVGSVFEPQARDADVLVLVNPNNPDGRQIPRDTLIALASARSARGLWTVVDESFVEVAPELSVADVRIKRLVVLRSFGKFYGLPGARLGFSISNKALAEDLRLLVGDWPVGADALALGRAAYADQAWRRTAAFRLAERAMEVDQALAEVGLKVIGGCDLFRWVEAPEAHALFGRLCEQGVLTRPFADHPDRLRIGLPPQRDLQRLRQALEVAHCER